VTSSDIRGGRSVIGTSFSLNSFGFPLLINISPLLHTHLSPSYDMSDSPDQAAQYHALGTKLGA
jgi:hypothetical protein